MRELQYTSNSLDLDICWQGCDSEQYSKDFSRQSLFIKRLLIKSY